MSFLFTYGYRCRGDSNSMHEGECTGQKSIRVHDIDKITEKTIDSLIRAIEQDFTYDGYYDIHITPLGWFKFDEAD